MAIEEALKDRYDKAVAEAANQQKAALAEQLRRREADLAEQAKRREAAFAAETDPVKAACIDFDRFLSRYFLDAMGKVDVKKAPRALALHGLPNHQAALAAAEKYDGLHTQRGGIDDYSADRNRVLVIGCDYESVYSEATKITEEQERQLEEEREADEQERLEEHFEFIKQNGKKKQGPSGAYTVICYDLESNWPNDCSDGLTLDIGVDRERKGELAAEFEWGVLDGLMRFCKDGEGFEEVDTEDEEDYDEEEEVPAPRKRKRTNQKSQPKKKAKKSDPFKLHFAWRGRENGEGEIQNSDRNRGWIQFLNKKYLQFEGEASISFVGSKVKFSGYKVSTDYSEITKRWEDYSARAYEREQVGRWGGSSW